MLLGAAYNVSYLLIYQCFQALLCTDNTWLEPTGSRCRQSRNSIVVERRLKCCDQPRRVVSLLAHHRDTRTGFLLVIEPEPEAKAWLINAVIFVDVLAISCCRHNRRH